jgi:hypothetical protein
MLNKLKQQREDNLAWDIFKDDDKVGYYNNNNYNNNKPNSGNAICLKAFDSC